MPPEPHSPSHTPPRDLTRAQEAIVSAMREGATLERSTETDRWYLCDPQTGMRTRIRTRPARALRDMGVAWLTHTGCFHDRYDLLEAQEHA